MSNKVKYGLKNVHWASLEMNDRLVPAFGTPAPIPGAVSLSLDANAEAQTFFSGGVAYEINTNQGYAGSLEIAILPDDFRAYALGEQLDASHVAVERAGTLYRPFALMFEFAADKKHVRHVLYNCTMTHPPITGQTAAEQKEAQTDTGNLKASPLPGGLVKGRTTDTTPAAAYDAWFDGVYINLNDLQADSGIYTAFTLDDLAFDGLCELGRVAEIKQSEISGYMMDRSYFADILGTYLSYTISLKLPMYDKEKYDQIYEILTAPVGWHTFTAAYGQDVVEIVGRVEGVNDIQQQTASGLKYWDGLSFTITGNHPTKQMSLGEAIALGFSPVPAVGAREGDIYQYEPLEGGWVQREWPDADERWY